MTAVLSLAGVSVARGAGTVVADVDLAVAPDRVTLLLGANGAGKTTLLEAVSGVLSVASGAIRLDGRDITRLSRKRRADLGLSHVQEGRAVFRQLTTADNLRAVGARPPYADAVALFPDLEQLLDRPAGLLSGGEQQMLVLARALCRRPRLLMVDELSLGLAPVIVTRLLAAVRTLATHGVAVLVVEQFAKLALHLADDAYVLDRGRIAYAGPAADLLARPELLHEAYLGSARLGRDHGTTRVGPRVTP
jgi:branched-chain amino acid transport system ATP-binding protein